MDILDAVAVGKVGEQTVQVGIQLLEVGLLAVVYIEPDPEGMIQQVIQPALFVIKGILPTGNKIPAVHSHPDEMELDLALEALQLAGDQTAVHQGRVPQMEHLPPKGMVGLAVGCIYL